MITASKCCTTKRHVWPSKVHTVNFYRTLTAIKVVKRGLFSLQRSFPSNITAYAHADGNYVLYVSQPLMGK